MIGTTLVRINQQTLVEALQEYFDRRLNSVASQQNVVRVSVSDPAGMCDVREGAALECVVVHLLSEIHPPSETTP